MLDLNVAILHPSERLKSLPKRSDTGLYFRIVLRERMQEHDASHALGALRPRLKRPRRSRAAKQRDELAPFHLTEMHPIPSRAGSTSQGYRISADTQGGPRDRAEKPRPGPADALPLGGAGRKPTREPRIRLRSQRSEQLYRRSLQRPAIAFALGKHPSHPFGNDAIRVAAVTATAVIDRLRIVAEADDCAVANRTDLNRRHGSACSGSNCQLTAGASPRTDKRSLRCDARRQVHQARQRGRDGSRDRLGR